jgi:hypothetical protein
MVIELRLSASNPPTLSERERTLQMRLHHVFFELDAFVRDLKANAKIAGPRTRKYHEFFSASLEAQISKIKLDLQKINYFEP